MPEIGFADWFAVPDPVCFIVASTQWDLLWLVWWPTCCGSDHGTAGCCSHCSVLDYGASGGREPEVADELPRSCRSATVTLLQRESGREVESPEWGVALERGKSAQEES